MIVTPVDQAVITRALIAAADEMGVKLIRSAHSPVVREAQDCSAAILDKFGRVVAQAELIPIQLGSITHTFKACLEYHPLDTLSDGDFLINNDPYSGGQHLPDIFLFTPVFLKNELIGVTATVVHHIDLGGGAPGLNPDAGDVHEEGITFPPSKYTIEKDWMGGPFERLVRANVRMPEATIGDLNAQFAANAVGAERLRDLCRKFSSERIKCFGPRGTVYMHTGNVVHRLHPVAGKNRLNLHFEFSPGSNILLDVECIRKTLNNEFNLSDLGNDQREILKVIFPKKQQKGYDIKNDKISPTKFLGI